MGKMHAPGNEPTSEQRAEWDRMAAGVEHEQRPCPRCGVPQGNVPNHLRACDGGASDGE